MIIENTAKLSFYKSLDWVATYTFYVALLLSCDVFYRDNPGKWTKPKIQVIQLEDLEEDFKCRIRSKLEQNPKKVLFIHDDGEVSENKDKKPKEPNPYEIVEFPSRGNMSAS